jgi:hypothetical protein
MLLKFVISFSQIHFFQSFTSVHLLIKIKSIFAVFAA